MTKHFVYSARTTEKGLAILNKLKGDKSWDQFVNEAVAAHYSKAGIIVRLEDIQLPPSKFLEEQKAKREAKEAEKAAKKAEREAAAKAKAEAKAEADKAKAKDKAKKEADKAKAKAKADAEKAKKAAEKAEPDPEPEPRVDTPEHAEAEGAVVPNDQS